MLSRGSSPGTPRGTYLEASSPARGSPAGKGSDGRELRTGAYAKWTPKRGADRGSGVDVLVKVIQNAGRSRTTVLIVDTYRTRGMAQVQQTVPTGDLTALDSVVDRRALMGSRTSDHNPLSPAFARLYPAPASKPSPSAPRSTVGGTPGFPGRALLAATTDGTRAVQASIGALGAANQANSDRLHASITSADTSNVAALGALQGNVQTGFRNLQAGQITGVQLRDRVGEALRGHEVPVSDAPRLRVIYGRYPRLLAAVKDNILTPVSLLRMGDDALLAADRSLAVAAEETQAHLKDAVSRTREQAEGRVAEGQSVRYADVSTVQQAAPFISAIPANIRLYTRPRYA